jgi:hypothetical protein
MKVGVFLTDLVLCDVICELWFEIKATTMDDAATSHAGCGARIWRP